MVDMNTDGEKYIKKIILASDVKGFMVNSIISELESDGVEVVTVPVGVTVISRHLKESGIILLYLDGTDPGDDVLTFLRDSINEKNISLTVVGRGDDITGVEKVIPGSILSGVFERPVNISELGSHFRGIFEKDAERHAKKKILVVDDDGVMLRRIRDWLSPHYQVFMVNSGMNAITFLVKNKVDLILLDYEMPVTSGPQVLSMLRSEPETMNIPVMFLTAKDDKESVIKVLSLKPENYLLKTLPPERILSEIDEFFKSRE
ncbi:MAG: response regulator [Lachnospiraceae bacterium]|nr:response regulator [Lachnospiraceae bacterium]